MEILTYIILGFFLAPLSLFASFFCDWFVLYGTRKSDGYFFLK